jgi:hypothetical protein
MGAGRQWDRRASRGLGQAGQQMARAHLVLWKKAGCPAPRLCTIPRWWYLYR